MQLRALALVRCSRRSLASRAADQRSIASNFAASMLPPLTTIAAGVAIARTCASSTAPAAHAPAPSTRCRARRHSHAIVSRDLVLAQRRRSRRARAGRCRTLRRRSVRRVRRRASARLSISTTLPGGERQRHRRGVLALRADDPHARRDRAHETRASAEQPAAADVARRASRGREARRGSRARRCPGRRAACRPGTG